MHAIIACLGYVQSNGYHNNESVSPSVISRGQVPGGGATASAGGGAASSTTCGGGENDRGPDPGGGDSQGGGGTQDTGTGGGRVCTYIKQNHIWKRSSLYSLVRYITFTYKELVLYMFIRNSGYHGPEEFPSQHNYIG